MSKKPIAKARSKAAGSKPVRPKEPAAAKKIAAARKNAAKPELAAAEQAAAASRPKLNISIRMYRLGVGDCFLVSLPKGDGTTFRMLIDCGIHQSKAGGAALIKEVVANLKKETDGKLDVVVATHEHWDHVSGFHQAADQFLTFEVGEVWVAWTEDSDDSLARSLKDKRARALASLGMAESRLRLAGHEGADNKLSGLLGFFGDTTGANLQKAAAVLKKMGGGGKSIRYREPGESPIELPGGNARIFVLGPPRDKAAIHRSDPRKDENEVYAFGAYAKDLEAIELALLGESVAPFDDRFAIPLTGTKAIPFFQGTYWADRAGSVPERTEPMQDWRRIDDDWLGAATSLGLKLDEDTNNTSLVLALELGPPEVDGPVLLFAADAQVGNWLSWEKVEWKSYKGRRITGPDLLRRTILYKVGHHASHNATLSTLGLELMTALEFALVPTDVAMAKDVGWGTLPWPSLLTELGKKTKDRVIRTDEPLNKIVAGLDVDDHELFYQVNL